MNLLGYSITKKEPGTDVAVAPKKPGLVRIFADRYDVDADKLLTTLKMTVFKPKKASDPEVTTEQMMALLVVANEYQLNPFTKEIYAFPSAGTIVPIVSIDGWMRITNSHPKFDGMEFEDQFDDDGNDLISVTCRIFRTDRSRPTVVTEYLCECKKDTGPWNKWPARMLRHKAAVQCARYAFGFSGIYDPDEAERIAESEDAPQQESKLKNLKDLKPDGLPAYPESNFTQNLSTWKAAIEGGQKSAAAIIATVQTKYTLSPAQIKQIKDCEIIDGEIIEDTTNTCRTCEQELTLDGACHNCGAPQ